MHVCSHYKLWICKLYVQYSICTTAITTEQWIKVLPAVKYVAQLDVCADILVPYFYVLSCFYPETFKWYILVLHFVENKRKMWIHWYGPHRYSLCMETPWWKYPPGNPFRDLALFPITAAETGLIFSAPLHEMTGFRVPVLMSYYQTYVALITVRHLGLLAAVIWTI